ncbi:tyrosine-type recombinase/integrase [Agromyces aerolatus]|nr:tyrosine-type recombinase/integrase [Agromyces sp. LY-1358]MDR5706236.1 tyrosine-type recombinase/integrase [Agromyces sp. LY-1358]
MEQPRKIQSGKWQARYTAPDGSRRSAGTFDTKKAAQLAMAKALTDIARGAWDHPDAGSVLFADYAARIVHIREAELTHGSWKNFETQVRLRLIPHFGKYPLKAIRPSMVKEWWSSQPPTTTRRAAYMCLSSIFRHAVDDEEIKGSPCRVRGASRIVSPARPFLDPEKLRTFLSAADEDFRMMILVTVGAGLRQGELVALNRRHFDSKTGVIRVEQHLVVEKGRSVIRPGTKPGPEETRNVTLPPRIATELKAYLKKRPSIGDVPMFVHSKGGRLSKQLVFERWKRLREKVGMEEYHFHDLRHTGLTLFAQGRTMREVMQRGGHRDYRSALPYQHSSMTEDAAGAAEMDRKLGNW